MRVNIEKINREMKALEWGILRLSKETGISRQGLYNILEDENASLASLEKLGKAFGIDPKDLLI